MAIYFGPF